MTTDGLYLFDGHSLLFRAHFAFFRNPLINSRGKNTSAVFGFMNMVLPLLEKEAPRYAAVAFDLSDHTFRNDLYPLYKANRPECPPEIIAATEDARKLVSAMNLPVVVHPGFEADDVLGTLARRFAADAGSVTIVTGDRDALQLVDGRIRVLLNRGAPRGDELFATPADVERELGVPPAKVPDLKGLQGDTSDNIPGVKGVGPKTAVKLLTEHDTLDGVYAALPGMKASKLKENLSTHREDAFMSRTLGTIVTDVPIATTLAECERRGYDREKLLELTRDLELGRIARMIEPESVDGPAAAAPVDYRLVQSEAALAEVVAALAAADEVAIDTETTSLSPMQARLVGVSLSVAQSAAWYVPVGHRDVPDQLPVATVMAALEPVLGAAGAKPALGQNLQYDWLVLKRHGLTLANLGFDTMVAAYVLNPTRRRYDLKTLALEELGMVMRSFEEVAGKDKGFDEVPLDSALGYAAADADAAFRLTARFRPALAAEALDGLYRDVELPLVTLLARMQEHGIRVDPAVLATLGRDLETELAELQAKAEAAAGESFNLGSPAQLARILFEKQGYEPVKKTKTGFSTDADVLRILEARGSEVARLVNRHRHLAKLKGTYVDTLPGMIHPETGRVHAGFHQTIAATGRISSSDPNLQNIPIRTPEGRRIREAFVAAPGHVFVSADYSQIELRILAHMCGSKLLREAFAAGADVHRRTAGEVFGIPEAEVTPEQRSRAKSINFGLIYGQSAHGLAADLGITRTEAGEFIKRYFERLPEVSAFLEKCKEEARERGFVSTLLGRRRSVPEIASRDPGTRAFAERIAVNTPIQGSAADLIKVAMRGVEAELMAAGDRARMVLQIHDELVVETPEDEADRVEATMRRVMAGALALEVPIEVNVSRGRTWAELK